MRVLIDTCVVIDALQKRKPFWQNAEKIFIAAGIGKFFGCISAKSITDIHYLMHKNLHSEEKTRSLLKALFELFEIVDTAGVNCINAANSEITDYEDAVQVETAFTNGIDCIVTRNIGDYEKSILPVFTPEDFLKEIEKLFV